jgi:hypothetical protein
MNPFGDLSDQNGEQVKKYLKFFRQKREGFVRSVANEIQECKNDRVTEDMYSREDVEDIVDFLNSAIRVRANMVLPYHENYCTSGTGSSDARFVDAC